jgi:hypothetical protein
MSLSLRNSTALAVFLLSKRTESSYACWAGRLFGVYLVGVQITADGCMPVGRGVYSGSIWVGVQITQLLVGVQITPGGCPNYGPNYGNCGWLG